MPYFYVKYRILRIVFVSLPPKIVRITGRFSLIHIHNNHDFSNGVVIFCVMGKNGKRAEG